MFEARLSEGAILKKIVDSVKDLVDSCNIELNDYGISLQAMDMSHIALVSLLLNAECFDPYRCDRSMTIGLKLTNLGKLLKCAGNDDIITLRAEGRNELILMFESPSTFSLLFP